MLDFFKKRFNSFGYALKGIATFFRSEAHPKIHALAVIVITGLGLWLSLSTLEWCLIVICYAIVLVAEAINSAIERVIDLVSPEEHPLAGKAKDIAAGAVLMGVIFCGIVWGLIFLPKLYALI